MILGSESIIHASSMSSRKDHVELELEGVEPALGETKGTKIVFVAMFDASLVIVVGVVTAYDEVKADPDAMPEQEVFARVALDGYTVSVSI